MTALIILFFFLGLVGIGAFMGYVRGLGKSVVRIVTIVAAAIATFIISVPVTEFLANTVKMDGYTLGEILLAKAAEKEFLADILKSAPLMGQAIEKIPTLVFGVIVFPAIFVILQLATWIVYAIFNGIFLRGGAKGFFLSRIAKRFIGAGIGAVSGAIIFGMIMVPFFGFISILPSNDEIYGLIDTLHKEDVIKAETADSVKNELATIKDELEVIDSYTARLYSSVGLTSLGEKYLASISEISYDGEKTDLTEEIKPMFKVIQTAADGGLVTLLAHPDDSDDALYGVFSDVAFVSTLMNDMYHSKVFRGAIPEISAMAVRSFTGMIGIPEHSSHIYDNAMKKIAETISVSDIDIAGLIKYAETNGVYFVDGLNTYSSLMTREEFEKELEKLKNLKSDIADIVKDNIGDGNEAAAAAIAEQLIEQLKAWVREGHSSLAEIDAEAVISLIVKIDPNTIKIVIPEGEDNAAQKEDEAKASASATLEMLKGKEDIQSSAPTFENIKEKLFYKLNAMLDNDEELRLMIEQMAKISTNISGAVSGIGAAVNP